MTATDPSKVENTQRLDNFLTQRPDAQELVDKNILKDPKVAPALQQQRDELSKARIQDTLRHKIDHRPTREELVEHHILEPAMGEDFQKMQDSLKEKITERPDRETLVQQGILAGNETCGV
ncbi:hypothetical protein O0I10_001369 [Lichtheimia ornata]|uniref:RPEL repeat protein n=1 Tax=Lichtheimia ornata TaxID=688661 RepID=A0AAD7Y3P6_9FUNG|nr:uncharacterized protein O0I10_001369 [Lichtheimia ornata]KAJ8663192.1 hypothetical protein O0I10_001369 [Lichtheimia ornata]